MRVMAIVKASGDSEAGKMPSQELLSAMGRFNEELTEAGLMITGEGLRPSSKGARVSFGGEGDRAVTDGPFTETKEQLGGYYIVDVETLDEALEWAAKIPSARVGSIEVRPVMVFDREEVGA
jgi:hypothetical protein